MVDINIIKLVKSHQYVKFDWKNKDYILVEEKLIEKHFNVKDGIISLPYNILERFKEKPLKLKEDTSFLNEFSVYFLNKDN